jgi:hypothetical protein
MRVGRMVLKTLHVAGLLGVVVAIGMGCDDEADPGCEIEPTLTSIRANVFGFGKDDAKGCTFGSCHDSRRPEGDLDLEADGVHGRLVNVVAANIDGEPIDKILVIPGDPDNSFLIQKLEGTQGLDEGKIMPDDAPSPVDPECRIMMIRQWITDGALDN